MLNGQARIGAGIGVVLALAALAGCGDAPKGTGPALPYQPQTKEDNPKMLVKTSLGEVKIELFEDAAPNTVANFIVLAERGYYDKLVFHRIIPNFCIQGGCPEGTGKGNPGYFIPDEFTENPHKNEYGTLAMANAGPNTNGSQFFFNINKGVGGNRGLDGKHTVFGKVLEGQDVLEKLAAVKTTGDKPVDPPKILGIQTLNKRSHTYEVYTKLPVPKPEEPAAKTGEAKTGETKTGEAKTEAKSEAKTEAKTEAKSEAKTEAAKTE